MTTTKKTEMMTNRQRKKVLRITLYHLAAKERGGKIERRGRRKGGVVVAEEIITYQLHEAKQEEPYDLS